MKWLKIKKYSSVVHLDDIPLLTYQEFFEAVKQKIPADCHCSQYFAVKEEHGLRFYCLLVDNSGREVLLNSWMYGYYDQYIPESLTREFPMFHPFEREISEKYGIKFKNNPYDKPLRFPFDRFDKNSNSGNYPYYTISGHNFHEVNVGPIHAGIIEPGIFRFICNGEKILHMEVVLGFQHRGMENLIEETDNVLRRICLAENIAGDTAVSHAWVMSRIHEVLADCEVSERVHSERDIAQEIERIAMHVADTAALCADVGYQLGQVACEAIRTLVINTMLMWCGNRFGKGLIRTGGTYYPLDCNKKQLLVDNIEKVKQRFANVCEDIMNDPSVLGRFEDCGYIGKQEVSKIGCVGMAARSSGLERDIRKTLPYAHTSEFNPVILDSGDVMSRFKLRYMEVMQSCDMIDILTKMNGKYDTPSYEFSLKGSSFAYAFTEGWRGEICHVAITDRDGKLRTYKVKDPSIHNWYALSLCIRGEEISNFPICNKSFNLSYCGHDL